MKTVITSFTYRIYLQKKIEKQKLFKNEYLKEIDSHNNLKNSNENKK